MKNKLVVVGIQANLKWEKPNENLNNFKNKIKNISQKIDLVVLPEMFTSGFSLNAKKNFESMSGNTISWMQQIAQEFDIALCGSITIKENTSFFNRFIFVHPSRKIDFYDKRHCFSLASENKIFTSGKRRTIIEYKGWKIFPQICYDLRFPTWSRNTLDYDLLIYVASWPKKRVKAWKTLLKARAIENMVYTIGVNRIGIDDNKISYSGASVIFNFLGKKLSSLKKNEEGFITATLEKKEQKASREKMGFLKDRDAFKFIDLNS